MAARAYFEHGRDDLLTLFEIIFRVLNDVRSVGLDDVPCEIRGDALPRTATSLRGLARASTELVEKQTILDALTGIGSNVTHAAKALGISRATLQNKMKAYGLRNPAKSR